MPSCWSCRGFSSAEQTQSARLAYKSPLSLALPFELVSELLASYRNLRLSLFQLEAAFRLVLPHLTVLSEPSYQRRRSTVLV